MMRTLQRWALLLCGLLAAALCTLPAAAETPLAPYAYEGDYDYIMDYAVTVDPLQDGSAIITYDIDWQVLRGDATEYLSWVKIGLANRHADDLVALSDTIADLQYLDEGGSYAKVVLAHRYYAPDVAAQNGGESRVSFKFSVHQSHLFTMNDDGTADFTFTPGWFDELCVERLTLRWRAPEFVAADNNAGQDGDYLVWQFGPLDHGESAEVNLTVPTHVAANFDTGNQLRAEDFAPPPVERDPESTIVFWAFLVFAIVFVYLVFVVVLRSARRKSVWGGGLGEDYDPDDWYWYTNGTTVVRQARHLPPPRGYHMTDPPAGFHAGGGRSRGGGVGRSSHHSSCACASSCACVSSCACACACAGGGRAGCSVKNFYTVALPQPAKEEHTDEP